MQRRTTSCCIAVLGVWNWRGTKKLGGKVALPDFEVVVLNGRDVYLFDSDVVTKPTVRKALDRLAAMLRTRGATVRIVRLPAGQGGMKVGFDDFLTSSKTVTDLLGHVVYHVDDGEAVGHEKLTLAEFAAQWLEAVEPSVRPSTFRRYADMLRVHILPQLGTRQLAKLTPSDLQRFYANRLASGRSSTTVSISCT